MDDDTAIFEQLGGARCILVRKVHDMLAGARKGDDMQGETISGLPRADALLGGVFGRPAQEGAEGDERRPVVPSPSGAHGVPRVDADVAVELRGAPR